MSLASQIAAFNADVNARITSKVLFESIKKTDVATCFNELAGIVLSLTPDGILSGLDVNIVSPNIVIFPGAWNINNSIYQTLTNTTIPYDPQDATLSRFDVLYADTFNTINLISGNLSLTPVEPNIPDNTVKVGSILITPTAITIIPVDTSDFVDTLSDQLDIGGNKGFLNPILIPTVTLGDNSNFGATTAFVQETMNAAAIYFDDTVFAGTGSSTSDLTLIPNLFVNNQTASAQTASYWINGTGQIGGANVVTSNYSAYTISKNIGLNADNITGALLTISGTVSALNGHTGTAMLAINSTSTLSSVFNGPVYSISNITNAIQVNYPAQAPAPPYFLTWYDHTGATIGKIFDATGDFTWGSSPTDLGYAFGVNGSFGTTGQLTFTGLASGTPVTGKYLALNSGNQVVLAAGGSGGGGTVTNVAGVNSNGFSWTIANATTTPSLTLSLQNATTSLSGQLTNTDWNTFNGKYTLPALTAGSVLLSDGTTITQDNANLFYNKTTHQLGVGTNTPTAGVVTIQGNNLGAPTYPYLSYTAFGDSITVGWYATPAYNIGGYAYLLASTLGLTVSNQAVVGNMACDQQDAIFATTVSPTTHQLFTLMIGTNDCVNYSGVQSVNYQNITLAEAAWLAIPSTKKILGQSGGPTYTGTWTNSTLFGGAIGKYSSTSGDTVSASATGTTIYVGYTIADGNGGQFSLKVDGVTIGTYNSYGPGLILSTTTRNYASGLIRVPGLSAGAHTVLLTVTSSTGAGNKVYLDWVAGNTGANTASGPTLIQLSIPTTIEPQAQFYNTLIGHNIALLQSDGLNVSLVDVTSVTENLAVDIFSGDGVHPTTTGHLHIDQALLNGVNVATFAGYTTTSINSGIGVAQLKVLNNGYVGILNSLPINPLVVQGGDNTYDGATSIVLQPIIGVYASTGVRATEIRATIYNSQSIGIAAGMALTTGADNNFFGNNAGAFTSTGYNNNFLGNHAGYANTTGYNNNFAGNAAGIANTTGFNNNFQGYQSGTTNTTGSNNNFSGYFSGFANTTGTDNNFSGFQAGANNTTGHDNNCFGNGAGNGIHAGYNNNFFGNAAGQVSNGGHDNNFLGWNSGVSNTTGYNNNFLGNNSGAGNTTGHDNNFIGFQSGQFSSTGTQNNCIGGYSGNATSTGVNNNFFGYQAGYNNTTGHDNVAIGDQAMHNGSTALQTISNSVFIGAGAISSTNGITNSTALGNGATVTASNQMMFGNSSVTLNVFNGSIQATLPGYSTGTILSVVYNSTNNRFESNTLSGGGTVTSITAGTGLSGGTITASGTIAVNASQVISTLSNLTSNGPVITSGGTGALSIGSTTGTGNYVLSTSPNFTTPALGTPSAVVLTNATGLVLTAGVTGVLPVANGGTGTSSPALVAGTNVTITGTWPNQTINASGGGGGSGTVTSVTSANTDIAIATTTTTPVLTLNSATAATASTIVKRDSNVNIFFNNGIGSYATTTTAGGTTTLTNASAMNQTFTAANTQTVVLPVTSTLTQGFSFFITNNSTQIVTVQSSGGNTVQAMAGNTSMRVICNSTSGTTAASWDTNYNATFTSLVSLGGGSWSGNIAVGTGALTNNTGTGFGVIGIGYQAGYNNTDSNEVLIGYQAGFNNTGGALISIGYQSGYSNTGTGNIFIGSSAGHNVTSSQNLTIIGAASGTSITTGGSNSTLVGNTNNTGNTASNTIFGQGNGSTSMGTSNTLIGTNIATPATSAATFNVALGFNAGFNISSGGSNTLIGSYCGGSNSTATNNSYLGFACLYSNTTGSNNVALGYAAGRFISGGSTATSQADNSIFIGYNTQPLGQTQTNQIVIGYQTTGNGSNTATIGNSSITANYFNGSLVLKGTSSGAISIIPQAAAGTYNFNLPITVGSAGLFLASQGGGSTAMTWVSAISKPHTIFTPTTGATVALVNNQYNIINPSGALVALTVNLPSSPANNDAVYIKFTQTVSTVTYGNGTVVDGITAPTAGGLTVLIYDSGTTSWY